MAKVIVSYDGTDNDRDALALGKLLARAGASLALAYVRHGAGHDRADADALLAAGAAELGGNVPMHVVTSGSTPEGLRNLAVETGADVVVFGSEYRTAKGHVDPQASAKRLIDGGPIAVGLAPAGFHEEVDGFRLVAVAPVAEDGDPCVLETAEALASRLGGVVAEKATSNVDLMVVGSKPGTVTGRVRISAAAEYLIELAPCPVLVLPRGVGVEL
jgi:nucleotide-binding universal stress UspA family protein